MKVILYTTGCPKCNVLKKKLAAKGIEYIENNDTVEMQKLGINQVPVLSIDGKLYAFAEANQWVNNQQGV